MLEISEASRSGYGARWGSGCPYKGQEKAMRRWGKKNLLLRGCLDGVKVCVKFLYHFSLLFGKIYLIID
jgi:hypothetical protein